jgi:hypothetical protein
MNYREETDLDIVPPGLDFLPQGLDILPPDLEFLPSGLEFLPGGLDGRTRRGLKSSSRIAFSGA